MDEPDWRFRTFTISGKVYSGNESHARHTVYWALRNSEADSEILIEELAVGEDSSAAN